MTKERLEELIKQRVRKKLWSINFFIYDLENCHIEDGVLMDDTEHAWCEIKNLYETKEQAEWAVKTVAERTERFEPPMWEDIENEYKFFFIHNEDYYCFYVNKKYNEIDFVRNEFYSEFEHEYDVTKENYEKACEIVRDLFMGANNGQQ